MIFLRWGRISRNGLLSDVHANAPTLSMNLITEIGLET